MFKDGIRREDRMKKLIIIAAVAASIDVTATQASAAGCASPFCQGPGFTWGSLFQRQPVPAFQAAPWYLYWPYNAHFQTPAPLTGPYYAPPYNGAGLVNPYFPAQPPVYPVAPVPPGAATAPVPVPPTTTVPAPLPVNPAR